MNADDASATDAGSGTGVLRTAPASSSADAASETTDATNASGKDYSIYRFIHAPDPRLEDCIDSFWAPAVPLEDLPRMPPLPEESHEILKRLGPSPFAGSSFPLIGFFATAYERVSRFTRERTQM